MLNSLLGLMLAFFIGAGCRFFGLPLPAPGRLGGALLVLTMTLGFFVGGEFLS